MTALYLTRPAPLNSSVGIAAGLIAAILGAWTIGSIFFPSNGAFLYTGLDGHYLMLMPRHQLEFNEFVVGTTNNFLQGRGGVWMPVNTYFDYSVLPFLLFNKGDVDPVLAYSILTIGFSLSIFFLLRSFRFSPCASLIAASATVALCIPFRGYGPLYYLYSLSPIHCVTATYTNLFVYFIRGALLKGAGAYGYREFAAAAILFINCIVYPVAIVLWLPYAAVLIAPAIITAITSGNLRKCFQALAPSVAISIPLSIYLFGLVAYSAGYTFDNYYPVVDLQDVSILFEPVSGLLFPAGMAQPVFVLAISSVLLCLFFDRVRRVIDTMFVLLGVAAIVGGGYIGVKLGLLHKPRPIYIETYFWVFYTAYIVAAAGLLAETVGKWIFTSSEELFHGPRRFLAFTGSAPLFLSVIFAQRGLVAFVALTKLPANLRTEHAYPYPPAQPPMIAFLRERVALATGQPFRGRVFTDLTTDHRQRLEAELLRLAKNDHFMVGLWAHDIPTVIEYSFLASPMAVSQPNNYRGLAAFYGARYFITDTRSEKAPGLGQLVMEEKLSNDLSLFLYELEGANTAGLRPYRPTQFVNSDDFWRALSSGSFDPNVDFWNMQFPESSSLTPASSSEITVVKGGIRVRAASTGTSIIILPLEYSYCLVLDSGQPDTEQRLFMANMGATGVRFSGRLDATIVYRYGPFEQPLCRWRDYWRFMGLKSVMPTRDTGITVLRN